MPDTALFCAFVLTSRWVLGHVVDEETKAQRIQMFPFTVIVKRPGFMIQTCVWFMSALGLVLYIYKHIHVHICTYTYMYIHMYMHTYTYMYVIMRYIYTQRDI